MYNWFLLNITGTSHFWIWNNEFSAGFWFWFIFLHKYRFLEYFEKSNHGGVTTEKQSIHYFPLYKIFRSHLHDIRWLFSSPACSPEHVTIDSFYYSFVLFRNSEYGTPFKRKRCTFKDLVKNSKVPESPKQFGPPSIVSVLSGFACNKNDYENWNWIKFIHTFSSIFFICVLTFSLDFSIFKKGDPSRVFWR